MSEKAEFKCRHCGGPIAFVPAQAGQMVSCPHCAKDTLMNSPAAPRFFVWLNDQQQGPFDRAIILQMIAEGQIFEETLLLPDDGGLDWSPASELLAQTAAPEDLVAPDPAGDLPQFDGLPAVEIKVSPYHSFFYKPARGVDTSLLVIGLTSGTKLNIKAVRLYDEISLQAINAKRTEAAGKPPGTGPGLKGSLEGVLAASAILSAVDGTVSAGAAGAGNELLVEAMRIEKVLRKSCCFLPVGLIENIACPLPAYWRVPGKSRVQLPPQKTPSLVGSAFIHNGDDFVTVQTDDGVVRSIRWSAVETYDYQE